MFKIGKNVRYTPIIPKRLQGRWDMYVCEDGWIYDSEEKQKRLGRWFARFRYGDEDCPVAPARIEDIEALEALRWKVLVYNDGPVKDRWNEAFHGVKTAPEGRVYEPDRQVNGKWWRSQYNHDNAYGGGISSDWVELDEPPSKESLERGRAWHRARRWAMSWATRLQFINHVFETVLGWGLPDAPREDTQLRVLLNGRIYWYNAVATKTPGKYRWVRLAWPEADTLTFEPGKDST